MFFGVKLLLSSLALAFLQSMCHLILLIYEPLKFHLKTSYLITVLSVTFFQLLVRLKQLLVDFDQMLVVFAQLLKPVVYVLNPVGLNAELLVQLLVFLKKQPNLLLQVVHQGFEVRLRAHQLLNPQRR